MYLSCYWWKTHALLDYTFSWKMPPSPLKTNQQNKTKKKHTTKQIYVVKRQVLDNGSSWLGQGTVVHHRDHPALFHAWYAPELLSALGCLPGSTQSGCKDFFIWGTALACGMDRLSWQLMPQKKQKEEQKGSALLWNITVLTGKVSAFVWKSNISMEMPIKPFHFFIPKMPLSRAKMN